MAKKKFDVAVIGGGPGGYVAAIRAAQLGMTVGLIEREHLGGVCLNWGCIPTKALLRSAEVLDLIKEAEHFGVAVPPGTPDIKKIVERSRQVAAKLSAGVRHLLKKNKVEVIEGSARVEAPSQLRVTIAGGEGETIEASHIILATGARARSVAPIEPDGKMVLSYKEAMTPESIPESLIIVGSGAIGIEFASFYRSLGCDVTVVEMQDRILPVEDDDVSAFARAAFEKRGMKIITAAEVKALKKRVDGVTMTVAQGGKAFDLSADRVISAVGIVGNVENLGLERTRVRVEKTHVLTDQWCRTDEPGIYAIGDVAGGPWLAHKASHEGIICVEKIAGREGVHPLDSAAIPGCTYSRPQVASVGLTERKAKQLGRFVRVGKFPYAANGKAIALDEPEGFVKTIFDSETGELLGAHMVGAEVTEMIQGFVLGKTLEATEDEFIHTVFPHPTLSEMMHEATLAAFGRAIHI